MYPEPGATAEKEGIHAGIEFPDRLSAWRPYVLINMVSSVDGRSSSGGRASGIGGRADRATMRVLRSLVDAVMVGAGTLRAERLNLGLDEPGARQPLAVIVGGRGAMPLERQIRPGGQATLLALPEGSPSDAGTNAGRAEVLEVPGSGRGRVDVGELLARLKTDRGVDLLLVEGGPSLNRSLIDANLADEIFLTLAPKLLAGQEAAIVAGGAIETPRSLDLVSVHSSAHELFLRYRVRDPE